MAVQSIGSPAQAIFPKHTQSESTHTMPWSLSQNGYGSEHIYIYKIPYCSHHYVAYFVLTSITPYPVYIRMCPYPTNHTHTHKYIGEGASLDAVLVEYSSPLNIHRSCYHEIFAIDHHPDSA